MLERRIDDYWNIEGDRDLSDAWTGFIQTGIHGPGCGWQRSKQHPGQITCGQNKGKYVIYAAQRKEKQKWAVEKPKFDNARKMRSIYFTDPTDAEFKETMKKRAGKVGSSDASSNALQDQAKEVQGNLSHSWCSQDKIRMHRWSRRIYEKAFGRNSYIKIMKTTLQEKETILCTNSFLCLKINENTRCQSCSGKRMEKTRENTGMAADESQKQKKKVIDEAKKEGKTVHFASWMDLCHLKSHCERWFRLLRSMYRARFISITNDGCKSNGRHQDAQGKQRTQYQLTPKSKWKMHRRYWKFKSQNVQIDVYHDTSGQSHGPSWKTQSFLLNEICTVTSSRKTIKGKAIRESSIGTRLGKKFQIWENLFVNREKNYSCLCMWTT